MTPRANASGRDSDGERRHRVEPCVARLPSTRRGRDSLASESTGQCEAGSQRVGIGAGGTAERGRTGRKAEGGRQGVGDRRARECGNVIGERGDGVLSARKG